MAGEVNMPHHHYHSVNRPTAPSNLGDDLNGTLAVDSTKAKEIIKNVLEIISGMNVKVSRGDDTSVTGAGEKKTSGGTNVPALDNPDDLEQLEQNLAKLLAYLQLDNEERQTDMAKDRIEHQKASLDKEHDGRMKEIDKSQKAMKDAEKASLASRIFGWIGAVLAVAAAIALTVVTGGVAAGFAIAGAVIAITSLVMNETGAMDALTEKLTESFKNDGMSSNDAKLKASLIINITMVVLSLSCSIGGMAAGIIAAGKAAADTAKAVSDIARAVQNAITIANTGVGAASLAAGGASTYYTYNAEDSKADVMELEKFIQQLQQRLEESEEELKLIIEQIEASLGKIAELLASATDTSNEIAQNLGQMA